MTNGAGNFRGNCTMAQRLHHMGAGLASLAAVLVLSGCVSFGKDPPPTLFTLTASSVAPAGQAASGTVSEALTVLVPDAPQRLDVVRVPVQVDDATVAYLKDAMWVEKPARLFGHLLAETIRAKQSRFVIEGPDIRYAAATKLSGQLLDMGYDAPTQRVVVRFDALLQQPDGKILTRRFEAEVEGVQPEAREVAPALNEAANRVAAEVAEWVG
jgi:cholesterol transport system auxiliary component